MCCYFYELGTYYDCILRHANRYEWIRKVRRAFLMSFRRIALRSAFQHITRPYAASYNIFID